MEDSEPPRVDASSEAGTYVRERGGSAYIWLRDVGPAYGLLRVTTERPHDVEWDELDAGGFRLFLDRELPRPREIRVTVGGWPWRRLRVEGFTETSVDGDPVAGHVLWDSAGGGGGNGGGGGGNGGG